MKKSKPQTTITVLLLAFLIVLAVCQSAYGDTPLQPVADSNRMLVDAAYEIVELIRNQDYISLSQAVHPQKGVTFTPYSYITGENSFSADALKRAAENDTSFTWGAYDGSGDPIILTFAEYFARFVYDENYAGAPLIGVNHIIGTGNSLENITEAYPEALFVEFHFPGIDPNYEGMDWCTLKLAFEPYEGNLKLVAVIHSEWTT